jgi:hypothetical protein
MARLRVSWLIFPAAVLVVTAAGLPAQESSAPANARLIPPDAVA